MSVDVVVSGQVQGVFFRATMREKARELDVNGWVRNEPDGSVAAHLEGSPDSVRTLVEWCHHGPSGALVGRVATSEAPATGASGFAIRQA